MPRSGPFLVAVLSLTIGVLVAMTHCTSRQDDTNVGRALDPVITASAKPLPPVRASIELEPASDPSARMVVQDAIDVARATGGAVTSALESKRPALMIEPGACAIHGRVVSATGVPVPGAEVVLLEVDWRGDELSQGSVTTEADGRFELSAERIGFVSIFVSHEAHGLAKRDRTREAWQSSIDLGDIALAPRGVLAGHVVGLGGQPLGRCLVVASPADEDSDFGWYETLADDDGRFCFAALERIPYTLEVEYQPSGAEFTPDSEGIVLQVALPSALVTVRGPDGVVLTEVELVAEGLERASEGWRRVHWRDGIIERAAARGGVFHVLFDAPGDFALEARARHDGMTWRAFERVEIGAAHHVLDLQLAPMRSQEQRVEVRGPDQALARSWSANFFDPVSGANGGSATDAKADVTLPVGSWTAMVSPLEWGFVLPFTQSIEVLPDTETLRLKAPVVGGRLTIVVDFGHSNRGSVNGTLTSATGHVSRFSVSRPVVSVNGVERASTATASARLEPIAPGVHVIELGTESATVTIGVGDEVVVPMSLR